MSISKIPKTRLAALNIGTADIDINGLSLSVLNQSGAADGQTISWSNAGTAWIPSNFSGSVTFIDAEVPSGSANSTNVVFYLTHNPSGTPMLFVGGQLMAPGSAGDYTFAGSVITFTPNGTPPGPNDTILAYYRA